MTRPAIKAIVLTYDPHAEITDLVLRSYRQHWPDHPFVFRVPYQSADRVAFLRAHGARIEFCSAPDARIRPTMRSLVEDLDDQQWVWWCMADKFLKDADRRTAAGICRWLPTLGPEVGGLMLTRIHHIDPHLDEGDRLAGPAGAADFVRKTSWGYVFYQHQFFRAHVLKEVFLRSGFGDDDTIYHLDRALAPFTRPIGASHPYVSTRNLLLFGESTHQGSLTPDCVAAFRMLGRQPPGHLPRTTFNMPVLRHVSGPDAPAWGARLAAWDEAAQRALARTEPAISVITYSKGRLGHARQSLPQVLSVLGPEDEVLVVDYNCPQRTGDWCAGLGDPRLKVVRVPQALWWWMNHARNCGGLHAAHEILLFMDIEGLPRPENIAEVRALPETAFLRFGTGRDRNGTCALRRGAFWEVNGFEEALTCYGYDDDAMYDALRRLGLHEQWLQSDFAVLETTAAELDYLPGADLLAASRRAAGPQRPPRAYPQSRRAENKQLYEVVRGRHAYKNNFGRNWGLGAGLDAAGAGAAAETAPPGTLPSP